MNQAVNDGVARDVVVMLADDSTIRYAGAVSAVGGKSAAGADVDRIFWLGSQTKSIVATAALQLVDRGLVDLDASVSDILPELATPQVLEGFDGDQPLLRPAQGSITLRMLLNHTSGLAYDMFSPEIAEYMRINQIPNIIECRNASLETPLLFDPGTRWTYGLGVDWAGKLVERLSGMPLDQYLQTNVFEPVGMTRTGFAPSDTAEAMPMTARGPDGQLTEIPFALPAEPEFFMGGGGLFSTARDFLAFQQVFLRKGVTAAGQRLISEESYEVMITNQIGDLEVTPMPVGVPSLTHPVNLMPESVKKWSLGFLLNVSDTERGRHADSYGWAGLANSYFWNDPASQMAGIVVTQALPFADPQIMGFAERVESAAYAQWD
ncbi:serine hydrolase domain-containing protein [Rhodococcus erythropolis]|uniref:serine hydrolase domain-containing protein n=1 Tax=Rhodococcus erythropolis TaxID=1833 RepID=UPI0021BEF008|nr:serine hydrolase domain-containing protein [Rhodococcus erythropolis]